MPAEARKPVATDPFKLTLLIFAIVGFMYFTGEVLKPLALSILLSFALAPVSRLFERIGLPRAPAVMLTVVLALGVLGGVGYVVGKQLTSLANGLPDYPGNIEAKLSRVIRPGEQSAADKLRTMADQVTAKMERPAPKEGQASPGEEPVARVPKVEVISRPSIQEQLRSAVGPYLEFLGVGSFVLVLVLFMLMGRTELSDRIVGLFGDRQVSLTTRTMQEIGQRITRYLATFALVNSCFGLVIGLGLQLIGVPYAVLWGSLAALLRFIPYVGPAVAFILPLVFSFAHFPSWAEPLEVVALFAIVETALNSYLEPVIYGKTTGVSALGLLVAAMFWTWLWGTMGLLLSTPLTVCLAVLGKYVPSLRFFAALLGEEVELEPDVRFYQRLVALDRDGATEVIEEISKRMPRVEIFDRVLIPALSRAERDFERDELNDVDRAFVWRVVGEVLDGLEDAPDFDLSTASPSANGTRSEHADEGDPGNIALVGVAVEDTSDVLILRMLGQLLAASGLSLQVLADVDSDSPLHLAEQVAESPPRAVVVSHLPPEGLTMACYLVRRLRAHLPELTIEVGRWGESRNFSAAAERLVGAGASHVVSTLAEARDRIVRAALPDRKPEPVGSPLPGLTVHREAETRRSGHLSAR
jgi:predicted PurR-regulated permease PerM